ncbi:MAG: tRNA pseudouridine(38-40) synthase TruA [Anaerolineae bacterium]|nr:tRNA pseudouridine(38-40) synthase TruA [Anaerolineae bacterium]
MRVKAVVAYDGTGYGGFQKQKNALSIQQDLERVLSKLSGTPVSVLAAGRTDAGVHAEGQVIAFDMLWGHALMDLQRAMNAILPEQIAVLTVAEVPGEFHPRYDALSRWYRYTLFRGLARNPLFSRYSLHISHPLRFDLMQIAAQFLLGQHDFWAFGSPPKGNNSVREVYKADWSEDGPWLYFDIVANAFLHRMVRMIVGTLLRVGSEALSPGEFSDILDSRDRRRAGPAIAARGLCLRRVIYEA